MRQTKTLTSLVVILTVTGCGLNAARLERANTLAQAGDVAIGQAKTFINQVKTARDDSNIALVASDESCAWGDSVVLRGDKRPNKRRGPVPLCLARGMAADERLGDVTISLAPVSETALRPTLSTIAALAAYLDTVNAILDTPPPHLADDIADAYAKALGAQKDLSAITASDLKVIPALKADQAKAITGLIKLIETLAAEQRKVDRLRATVRAQNSDVLAIIASLRANIVAWGQSSLAGDLQMTDAAYLSLGRKLAAEPPVYQGFAVRQALLKQIVAARRTAIAAPTFTAATTAALDDMTVAQTQLFDGLGANPHWSAEERRRAARLNRERLLAALHSIANVVTAF